jgi:ABC-2 type transport system ATP-binding protein
MVHELAGEGISIIWSTAYLDEAGKCDEVILLNLGEVLFYGPPSEMTKRVEGRTFTTHNHNRKLLEELEKRDDILDATIQGANIRIVTKKPQPQENWTPVEPRFEDGFMDILGGMPKGASKLAEEFPTIPKSDQPIIVARDLTKKFDSFVAADSLTFEIKRGEVFGLLGPNGAGKSTTFKMLCGLLKPTSGTAIVNGKSLLTAASEARTHIGYMAQKFSLYGELSVLQNLRFFSGAYEAPKESVGQMIDIFGFKPFLVLNSRNLPLGFKQRLALACAVMHHPEILFLDEPTSGVDPITRREFWNHINGLVGKGITVVITTHFMDEAEYCDRIGLIHQGKLITIGTPDSLKDSAKTPENPNPTLEDAFIHLIEGKNES